MQTSTLWNKKKIVMFGHKRIPSREGGIEVVVEELAAGLCERGYEVTCYNRRGHHVAGKEYDRKEYDRIEEKTYRGIIIKSVATVDKKGLAALTSAFFAAIASCFSGADIVHIHAEGPAIACFLPKLFGKKVIVTIHGLDHQRDKWGKLARKTILMGEKNAVKFADDIIVLSPAMEKYFWEKYNKKTHIIPNGVNKPQILEPSIIKEKWGLTEGYILFLARLVPEKGAHYLVEAYKNIKTDRPLVIAGGSSDSDEYVEKLKNTVASRDNIIFTGFVQGQVLGELYSNAGIYVLPSDLEGMPIGLLEAMSYGNCCITSDIPENENVIRGYGITFSAGSAADLRDKLRQTMDAPEIIEGYKRKSAEYVLNNFGWNRVVNETIKIYGN